MGIVVESVVICPVSAAAAFAYVDDYRNVPKWLWGLNKFVPVGDQESGLGAVFDGEMHLGLTLKSRIQTIGWEQDRLIALDSIKGFKNTSTWTFESEGEETRVTGTVEYSLPFGPAGKAMGKLIEPFVKKAVTHSSESLQRELSALGS